MTAEAQRDDLDRLHEASRRLAETMALGRIPLVVMGSGMSAGVFAPTMSEIHAWVAREIQSEAEKCNATDLPVVQTIQALLGQLMAAKPAQGWSGESAPASPRSIQVRLYNLLQTNKADCVRKVWLRFGEALLVRKMVTRDAGESFDANKTLAELDVSRAHAWAAILALQGRAIVASLNYDGLTRKAVEQLAKRYMALPPRENDEESRRTCRILSTAEDIHRFFSGIEMGLERAATQGRTEEKLAWRPIPVIKFRGDIFHAVCHNEQCPEAEKPTPLYFVLPSRLSDVELAQKVAGLKARLRCECCRHPRQLEISFPGVFDKELQIDRALATFHQFFGARLAGVIFLGFSGSWDETLVEYLARCAARLSVPVISLSLDQTPSLQDATIEHRAKEDYFYFEYESQPLPGHGDFQDLKLETLVPVRISSPGRATSVAGTAGASPNGGDTGHFRNVVYPSLMFSLLPTGTLQIPRSIQGHDWTLQFNLEIEAAVEAQKSSSLFGTALGTHELRRLEACSQLGVKGLLLREKAPRQHNRLRHSASATLVARLWYETLRNDPNGRPKWAWGDEGQLALEMAALYHDARHLPFSHMMEEIFGELNWGHRPTSSAPNVRRWTSEDIPDLSKLEPWLSEELKKRGLDAVVLKEWRRKVRAIQDGRTGLAWLEAIVDSALDADKIEYIFNDTKLTGQNVRLAEPRDWIAAFFSGQSVTPEGLIRLEGESCTAALELLRERSHLYRTLYLAPELRGLESLARYIVLTWLKWKVVEKLDFDELKKRVFSETDDLRNQKSKAAADLLWELFHPPSPKAGQSIPQNELQGVEEMKRQLTEGPIASYLDGAAIEWIRQLWVHLDKFKENKVEQGPNIFDARRAFERLSPRGPLYVHKKHGQQLREIARRWRIHYPLLGIIDLAAFPSFLATPSDRWEKIGRHRVAAEHFLVPGERPNEWRRRARASTPLHECKFQDFEYPVVQVLILDPYGDASGGGAFLNEMLLRQLQRTDIAHWETPEAVPRNGG